MNKLAPIISLAISIASAANIPRNCAEEIISISKGNSFDMQKFTSDLPQVVAKAKLQAKAPFGKPKDSDKTDIGITFGCLKSFPESPSEIQPLLKDIGLGIAKNLVATNNANTANIATSASAANVRSTVPVLKGCDAVFNPSKKFCYDGEVYNLCDGMAYNPTTHICSGDIANRALCNGTQYNPLKQKCENNTILAECGKATYNPATHGCKDNAVFVLQKCGGVVYDPKMWNCKDNELLAKCGEIFYDTKTHVCKKNVVLAKCGAYIYDPAVQVCKDNMLLSKCGEILYDPKTHECKDSTVFAFPKCGETPYNPATQVCKDNVVLAKCGAEVYYPAVQVCQDDVVLSRCGATELYNPKTQTCSYGAVFAK